MQVPLRKSERASPLKIYMPKVSHGLKARKSPCNRERLQVYACKSECGGLTLISEGKGLLFAQGAQVSM